MRYYPYGRKVFVGEKFEVYEQKDECRSGGWIYTIFCKKINIGFPVLYNKYTKVSHVTDRVHNLNMEDNLLDIEAEAIKWVEKNHA